MINRTSIERFTLENVIYIAIGSVLFTAPWMMIDEFWRRMMALPTANVFFGIVVFFVGTYILLHHTLGPKPPGFVARFSIISRRIAWSAFIVLLFDMFALIMFNRISLQSSASYFFQALLSAFALFYIGGNAFDLLMTAAKR